MKPTFLFLAMAAVVFSCGKDDPKTVKNESSLSEQAAFSAVLDGTQLNWDSQGAVINVKDNSIVYDTDNDLMRVSYQTVFVVKDPADSIHSEFVIGFGDFPHSISGYNASVFYGDFSPLPQTFGVYGGTDPGFQIHYLENGTLWTSSLGDQTGSVITITRNEGASNTTGELAKRIEGTASCKLYNYDDTTQFKLLENVSFKIYLYKHNF